MVWYLMEGKSDKKEALQAAGVPYTEMTIAKPRVINGLAFPEENRTKALEVLGLSNTELNEAETDQNELKLLEVRKITVEISAPNDYKCNHWRELAANLKGWLEKNLNLISVVIHVINQERDSKAPVLPSDGRLHIVIGAAINGISEGNTSYIPGGRAIGFSGLSSCPGSSDLNRITQELNRLFPLILATGEGAERIKAEIAAQERKRSREHWIKQSVKRFERTLSNTRDEIQKAQAEMEKAQQRVVEQIRIRDGQQRKLEQMEATRPQVMERYASEFDRLAELPHVVKVNMDGDKITVFTDRMYVEHNGQTYDIGDFRIEIDTQGRNGCVKMFNLTRQVNAYKSGMQAPHVFPEGNPCLGNLSEAIPQYIGEYEYSVVVMLCIQYLQSVNTSDPAGKYIEKWPVVENKKES